MSGRESAAGRSAPRQPVADRPAAHRIGQPSPLIFHLGVALSAYGQALLAAPRADDARFPWIPGQGADRSALAGLDQLEVASQIAARLAATVEGLEIWQRHGYRRTLEDPPAVWAEGCSRLLDYGALPEAIAPDGPPVLVIPSLINRAYILDLAPGASILRWLAGQGLRPLLMDWGSPGPAETHFDLTRYGSERLLPALAAARGLAGRPVPVVGYCMGGTLAVGLAARRPQDVAALATLGAPWDFASGPGFAGDLRALLRAGEPGRSERLLDAMGEAFGLVPVSVFQMLFALINPLQTALKFQKLARLDPESATARRFVALEDWLADGVPMPVGAAKDLLIGWQIRNQPARGDWRFLGAAVEPRRVAAPALVVCGETDSIAPPGIATALGRALPRARTLRPRTGHVGMIVGSAARGQVWRPLADFLAAHAG